jgi:hypothetical protein
MRAALIFIITGLVSCLLLTAASAADFEVNPWAGTWLLDTSQSKYSPGPPHRSATLTVTDAGNGKLIFVYDITDGAGEKDHTEFTCAMDRTECPLTAGGAKRTVSITKLHNRNFKLHWKFNDPPSFFVDMVGIISKDAQTQVAKSKGKLPDGTALAVTEVWRKA